MKRKASQPARNERPAKIAKESTTQSIEGTLSSMLRIDSTKRPDLKPVKLPSTRKKLVATRRQPTVQKLAAAGAELTFPALRKSETVKVLESPLPRLRTRSSQKSASVTTTDTEKLASTSSSQ
ncbi:hypothetical protein BsWGS_13743 [Bradybaena similaris]